MEHIDLIRESIIEKSGKKTHWYHCISKLLLLLLATVSYSFTVQAASEEGGGETPMALQECKVILEDSVLTISNSQIERQFLWNDGNLISKQLTDKLTGHSWKLNNKTPDCVFPGSKGAKNGTLKVRQLAATATTPAHVEAEIITSIGNLQVKRIFRLYPKCPAIACDYYVKGESTGIWAPPQKGIGDLMNIETKAAEADGKVEAVIMDRLALPGRHWRVNAVQFYDITDRTNTLTQEVSELAFIRESTIKGNLLFATDELNGHGVFMLKESPSYAVQLAYPGFDFSVKIGEIAVAGIGIYSSDLKANEWTRCYGVVSGVSSGGTLGKLKALRTYQQNIRIHQPGRDDMIMLNTWGDRSRDKRMGEEFALNEIKDAQRLGITHFQLDDGWQEGRSPASFLPGGSFENIWDNPNYWRPDPKKFPKGLAPVVEAGRKAGIEVCVWFNPSQDDSYAHWKDDANALIRLYKEYGIRTFKIDGVQITDKKSEINFRNLLDAVVSATDNQAVFNLDVTAGRRNGYHYFNEYGNIFLENRYTDFSNYYPHWTLRNLWMLSKYLPAQNLQIEFLNSYRNKDNYPTDDVLAPGKIPLEYEFAITMMAQPLAWMEASGLPEEGFSIAPAVKKYRQYQQDIHAGMIFPIGEEPTGLNWTGFQSMNGDQGYLLVFRGYTDKDSARIKTYLHEGVEVRLDPVLGEGKQVKAIVGQGGEMQFTLPERHSYALYKYTIAPVN